jgi:hypothetical protein
LPVLLYKGYIVGVAVLGPAFNCGVIWVYNIWKEELWRVWIESFEDIWDTRRLEGRGSAYGSARTFTFTDLQVKGYVGVVGKE